MAFNWIKFPWTNLHDLNLDWVIQTVKTLEDNLSDALALVQTTVDAAITKLLTGSGDLTISKTGDVRISGNSVQLSKTVISGAEQLTMHNTTSNTSMGANYNSGTLTLTNNQNSAAGVAVYPVNTPADGGGDNSEFAANVGYVKDAVTAVDGKLDTEISNRTSGDAALQSTIDSVIMPLINALQKRAPRVFYFENDTTTNTTQFMTAEDTAALKAALVDHTPIVLIAKTQSMQYCYLPVNCSPVPTADNIDDPNTDFTYTFQSANNLYRAMVSYSSSAGNSNVVFQTIS